MSKISVQNLQDVVLAVLARMGVPSTHADIIADSVLYAHTRGKHTHGIGRFSIYCRKIQENLMDPKTPITVIRQTPVIDVLDACNGFGQVAAIEAMDRCAEKAKQYGMGLVGVRNSNNFGTAGFIGERAVQKGMIGVVLSNSGPAIAPAGGSKPLFGTNPLCVSFPSDGTNPPIIFDMACSNAARGKIRLAAKNGESIPEGWAVDQNGAPTTDPNAALAGAMMAIGGYKGAGIAMCIDILAGMLTGSAFGGDARNLNHPSEPSRHGHMILAIDPDYFMERGEYQEKLDYLIAKVKACGESGSVYMPGERSYEQSVKSAVYVDIEQKLVQEFNDLAARLGISQRLACIPDAEEN